MQSTTDDCPDCGASMVERVNRRTGETFWGCSTYPDCKGTRQTAQIDDADLQSERAQRSDARRWERE